MARKKQTQSDNSTETSFLAPNRKIEILGVVIMAIALLLGLSIITHNSADDTLVKQVSLSQLFSPDGVSARILNGLGPLGAIISFYLVNQLFGYITFIFCTLVFLYGWKLFRHHDLKLFHPQAALYTGVMILIAAFLGWLHHEEIVASSAWSGSVGYGIGATIRLITGQYGPIVIFAALGIITLLFMIDRDIQVTIDRFKDWFAAMRGKMEERKEQKELQKAQREKEEAEATEQKEKEDIERAKQEKADHQIKMRQEAELREKEAAEAEAEKPSIDEIVEKSRASEEERLRRQKAEDQQLDSQKPRVILTKERKEEPPIYSDEEDDIEISVYKGEGDEEADERELDKGNKSLSKEIPVIKYRFPSLDLLDNPPAEGNEVDFEEINQNKKVILEKLKMHGIEITGIEAIVGPTVTLYELQPAPDVKISKIESYANDLKMAMATHGLRIIAPIPGKSKVGIEVPNRKREMVSIKSVIKTKTFVETKMTLPIAFGRTIENDVFMVDLNKLPHLLVAGATGSGKSVGINTIITCLLYKCHPENLKFVLVDPKKIELSLYRNIQNHYLATLPDAEEPIITDTSKVLETLTSVCLEMDARYELLKMGMVRDIKSYNEKFKTGTLEDDLGHRHLPYIVVIIDELADLMMTAGKQIEEPIARIAQLARAVGIHLVVATQRPSVNVITGTIKANFPARLAYRVASKIDSRTILDTMGADQLIGMGDMLFSAGQGMIRIQNAFVSTEEVERVTGFIGEQRGYSKPYYLPEIEDDSADASPIDKSERDELFEEAARVVVLHQQGSVSLLQRKLKLGYNRAGRIIDQLFAAGVVGPYQGSTARDVLVKDEIELEDLLAEIDE